MIINVSKLKSNSIHFFELKKKESEDGYDSCASYSLGIKKEKILSVLKEMIFAKDIITAEVFSSKLKEVSTYEPHSARSFGQASAQVIPLINAYGNMSPIEPASRLILSTLYLKGELLPKIEKMRPINGNMYFIIKNRKAYDMCLVKLGDIKCIICLEKLVKLYKDIKVVKNPKANPKKAFFGTIDIENVRFDISPGEAIREHRNRNGESMRNHNSEAIREAVRTRATTRPRASCRNLDSETVGEVIRSSRDNCVVRDEDLSPGAARGLRDSCDPSNGCNPDRIAEVLYATQPEERVTEDPLDRVEPIVHSYTFSSSSTNTNV